MQSRTKTLGSALAVVAACTLSLAACAVLREAPLPSTTGSPSQSEATDTPAPSDSPSEPGEAVSIDCAALVTDQTVYDWGSGNWALDPNFEVEQGTFAADAVAHRGTACGWINLSSNEKLTVAVAALTGDDLADATSEASGGTPVTTNGVDAYFRTSAGIGTLQVFKDKYWISASSTSFFEARDAELIVGDALNAVG